MRLKLFFLFTGYFLVYIPIALAGDVHVHGYTRKDGTYVRPYIRSAPDSSLANNYGPSRSSNELLNPRSRDNDRDGIPNYRDTDDDNDNTLDDNDATQYGGGHPSDDNDKNNSDE
jgi:hypothetical protein